MGNKMDVISLISDEVKNVVAKYEEIKEVHLAFSDDNHIGYNLFIDGNVAKMLNYGSKISDEIQLRMSQIGLQEIEVDTFPISFSLVGLIRSSIDNDNIVFRR